MAALLLYGAVFGTICWCSLLLLPWRPYRTSEQIDANSNASSNANHSDTRLDHITVLIPARNEAPYIQQTINCVKEQGAGIRVVVIDDQSSDDTAEQARLLGAQVISGVTPPTGWSGKLWALEQGLQVVQTPYTLLLDADIELSPGMVATLYQKARQENLALVSLMAQPPMTNFIERLLMPAFIFFFKLLYPFGLANKPNSKVAAAAGGCILVETQALRSINAFSSLHDALIDDCTLAAHIKKTGLRTWLGLSHDARSQRGYQHLEPIWQMVARTAYTQLKYSALLLFACTLIMVAMFWLAPLLFLLQPTEATFTLGAMVWFCMIFAYTPTLIYYDRSPMWVFALPVIGTLYLAMTWTSAFRYWRGERASWKNRQYER